MEDIKSKPKLPDTVGHLLTSAHHAAERAWLSLYNFLMVQSILALAWAAILSSKEFPTKSVVMIVISLVGCFTGFQWSLLGTRMWDYHLEYIDQLRLIWAAKCAGAPWREVEKAISDRWEDARATTCQGTDAIKAGKPTCDRWADALLRWMKKLSANHWIMFLAPLFLAVVHLFMFSAAVLYAGSADTVSWFQIVTLALAWMLFCVGLLAAWTVCIPALRRPSVRCRS
jgi:hypothetical protein